MARTRTFEMEVVLQAAAEQFAASTYAGTSIDQLVRATNLQRGSLYQAFASKAGLFRTCYAAQLHHGFSELLVDLTVIALWERASVDRAVGKHVAHALDTIAAATSEPVPDVFYKRMLSKADMRNK